MEKELPKVVSGKIGDELVQTSNARDLWVFLESRAQFADWIRDRCEHYDFKEGIDYVIVSEKTETITKDGHKHTSKRNEYHLTLDMAKELSMVERNEQGKKARCHYIRCERELKAIHSGAAIDGIVKNAIERALETRVPEIIRTHLARGLSRRYGRTAGEIWHRHDLPSLKNGPQWLANRLAENGATIEDGGCGELGGKTARLFDEDKANACMKNGLRDRALRYIEERKGQKSLQMGNVVEMRKPEPDLSGFARRHSTVPPVTTP